MDTLKERVALEKLHQDGVSPWALWRRGSPAYYRGTHVLDQVVHATNHP
jgi:hypothetical protein